MNNDTWIGSNMFVLLLYLLIIRELRLIILFTDLFLQYEGIICDWCIFAAVMIPHSKVSQQSKFKLMQFLSNLLRRNIEKCREHEQQVFWVCYDTKCAGNRFICKNEKCNQKHQGHKLNRYNQFKESMSAIERHIKLREQLTNSIAKYQSTIVAYIQKYMQEMKFNLFNKINKYCSPKFLEVQKLYQKKGDYTPLIYQFEDTFPEKQYSLINTTLNQKQANIYKVINKQQFNLDKLEFSSIIQTIRPNENQTEMKIKHVLPFKCDLKLKFRASGNQFLSKNLHSLNLRGPIVLYAKSHKNRQFGGYSSIMFPKYQEQQNIQNRNITAFLFSIDYGQVLYLKEQYKKYAIKGGINFGFGRGDLLISDQCHKGNISWAQIGRAYKQPSNIKGPLNQWLGGAAYFRVLQEQKIEVK